MSGGKMLRFLRADYKGKPNADGSYIADLYRLVDLRPYRQDLADGNAKVQISAAFNAIPFSQEEAYSCSVSGYALDAEMARNAASLHDAIDANGSLAMARKRLANLDRDPGTWQKLDEELRLPAETEFLLVHIAVIPTGKSPRRITFDGQYVDDVRITLVRRSPVP